MSGDWRWRSVRTQSNGQPALGFYAWDEGAQAYLPFALNVLTFDGDRVANVTAFIARSIESDDPVSYERFPEEPANPRMVELTFTRFGLPPRLD
jgi:RNA polymerase sigma-70 factor (ECF subfamily)